MFLIVDFDKQLFLDINRQHTEWLDPVMLFFSSYTSWAVVAILVLSYLLYKSLPKRRLPLVCCFILSVLSTNLLNHLVKVIVKRPRPIHEPAFADIIHAIEKFDASYSFFSAHSSSSFALAVFALLFVKEKWFTLVSLFWASAVAYSRIYVGKHYPGDVIVGVLFGILMGVMGWKMYEFYEKKKVNRKYKKYETKKNY